MTYTCERCGLIFESSWSDEEAHAEAARMGFRDEPLVVVCDDCWRELTVK